MTTNQLLPSTISYPESDGAPMAETDIHRDLMLALIFALQNELRQAVAYVAGNLFVYYQVGHPESVVAPDVFVVFGVPQEPHRTYKTWEHGGKAPDVVIELTSDATRYEDRGKKRVQYAELGVREYYLFDPLGDYLKPQLQGYELLDGEFIPLSGARIYSRLLNLELRPVGDQLRLYPIGSDQPLLFPFEVEAARQSAEAARRAAEAATSQESAARRAAEAATSQESAARRAAEAEVEQLRAEIARLRQGG